MAQYLITHACGHSCNHQLYGKESERARRRALLAKDDCVDCYRASLKPKALVGVGGGEVTIYVDNAYVIKDSLKAAGYAWNGVNWMLRYKAAPKSREEGIAIARALKERVDALKALSVEIELTANAHMARSGRACYPAHKRRHRHTAHCALASR